MYIFKSVHPEKKKVLYGQMFLLQAVVILKSGMSMNIAIISKFNKIYNKAVFACNKTLLDRLV